LYYADWKTILMAEHAAMANTDEELMASVATGDRGAFSVLLERYQGIIWRTAWRYTGNSEDARDICQMIFLKLYEARSRYKITAAFKTYIFRIANNVCIDHYRKKHHTSEIDATELTDPAPLSDERHEERVRDRVLHSAIAQLPERQRRAVALRYEAELPVKEIAITMGITQKAVERLLAHARDALRGIVDESAD
jgi:RNA polymerase sigma-70 factor, ECF subfamily